MEGIKRKGRGELVKGGRGGGRERERKEGREILNTPLPPTPDGKVRLGRSPLKFR